MDDTSHCHRESNPHTPMHTGTPLAIEICVSAVLALLLAAGGCASSKPARAELEEPAVQTDTAKKKVERNHFHSDKTGNLSEHELREMIQAPIRFETGARVGVVPVGAEYRADSDVPLETVPKALGDALEETGYFDVATEVATDWPKDRSVAGLRELAARYRSRYLVLYRHRFVTRSRVNGWGWTYPTVVGLFATPGKTVEIAGVLEATFFDVQNGSILFTAYERTRRERKMNIWHNDRKRREMKTSMMEEASGDLSEEVTSKIRRLAEVSSGAKSRGVRRDDRAGTDRR